MRLINYNQYLYISFIITLFGVVGSLYVSEVLHIAPCDLCWYQRIFMFSIPILSAVSILKSDTNIKFHIQTLALLGFCISIYQYVIQKTGTKSAFCSLDADCSTIHFELFGFITMPLLAGTAFLLVFLSGFAVKNSSIGKEAVSM